ANFDFDLGYERGIRGALEDRFHPVSLRSDAIDCDNLGSVLKQIDVVADIGIGWRKDHRAFAFDRQQLLLQMQRDETIFLVNPVVDGFGREGGHAWDSSCAKVTTLFLPERSSSKRNRLNGIVVRPPASAARASMGGRLAP